MLILKQEYVDKIKYDAELYGKVAASLGITAPSLRALLKANHIKLTQIGVIRTLKNYWGITEDSELLTDVKKRRQGTKKLLKNLVTI